MDLVRLRNDQIRVLAHPLRSRLLGMQKEYLIELGDAVVAVKQADGQVKLNQLFSPADQAE